MDFYFSECERCEKPPPVLKSGWEIIGGFYSTETQPRSSAADVASDGLALHAASTFCPTRCSMIAPIKSRQGSVTIKSCKIRLIFFSSPAGKRWTSHIWQKTEYLNIKISLVS